MKIDASVEGRGRSTTGSLPSRFRTHNHVSLGDSGREERFNNYMAYTKVMFGSVD